MNTNDLDSLFQTFVHNVKPRLNMGELQTVAAFCNFVKTGDNSSIPGSSAEQSAEISDDECFESDEDSEDEEDQTPTLQDLYGYENDEDNEEAAFDDALKMQERD